jgi:SAM-dependent methyltransferase
MNFNAFAPFYDGDYRNYQDDLQMVADLAQEAGERALELGCGTGRVMLPLAGMGHLVTGVDNSPALLAQARQKAERARLTSNITLVEGDLLAFRLERTDFDFAYCVSNTLMHLTTQTQQFAALLNAHRHLRPGGRLLIDLFNPDVVHLTQISGVKELADAWKDEERGVQMLKWCVRRLDLANQIQETLFIYEEITPDGESRQTVLPFDLRFWWPSEGELLLKMAGFQVEEVWGDFDGTPYDNGCERLIFLAQK